MAPTGDSALHLFDRETPLSQGRDARNAAIVRALALCKDGSRSMSDEALTADAMVVRCADGVICEVLDGELFLISPVDERSYVLNDIGARVWELLEEPTAFATLVEQLLREFAVDATTCEDEVRQFLSALQGAELISIKR